MICVCADSIMKGLDVNDPQIMEQDFHAINGVGREDEWADVMNALRPHRFQLALPQRSFFVVVASPNFKAWKSRTVKNP